MFKLSRVVFFQVSPLRNASGINSACGTSTVTRAQLPLAPTANINGIIQNGLHGHSSDNNRTAQTGSASSARVAANSVVDDDDDDIVEIFPHSTLQKSFNETRYVRGDHDDKAPKECWKISLRINC